MKRPGDLPARAGSAEARRRWVIPAATLASLAGFVWALHGLDLADLLGRIGRTPGWLWPLAAAGILFSHALRATRLHAEWQPQTGADWASCLRLTLLHNAAVLLMPLRSGELGYGWWLQRRWGVPWRRSTASLLWMRLQDLAVLVLLSALCLVTSPAGALIAAAGLLLAGLVLPLPARWSVPWPRRLGWACATANWSLRLAIVGLLLSALVGLPIEASLRGAIGGEWGALLPLQAPGGLGTYEAGVWAGLQAHALGRDIALDTRVAAALIVHLFWLAVSLLAAWPALLLDGPRPAAHQTPNPS